METNTYQQTWDSFDIQPPLLRGIYAFGFEHPSQIQQSTLPHLLSGKDVIAQAQSGTGKTGAFSIGVLGTIDMSLNEVQAIIISNTHELAKQTGHVIKELSQYMNINVLIAIGGQGKTEPINTIPHVICCTPGKLLEILNKQLFDTRYIKIIILDEADILLSDGFKSQIKDIVSFIPTRFQTGIFSATYTEQTKQIIPFLVNNIDEVVSIYMEPEKLTLDGIKQYYLALTNDQDKFNRLNELFESVNISKMIVYCNSVKRVIDLHEALKKNNYPVVCIHRDMSTSDRHQSFMAFKEGTARLLISTDITARGIDVQQVGIVVNFDIPNDNESYLHRIGRSGRYGRKGVGINFITKRDVPALRALEKHYGMTIEEMPSNLVL